jgi:uncharacterized protein (TIGR03067 family)
MSCCVFLATALSLHFAPAPFPKPARPGAGQDDLKALQGTWVSVRRTSGGREMKSAGATTVVIAGTNLKYLVGGMVRTEWVITLDTTKNPRILDRTKVGGAGQGVVLRGIYRLDGDTLTICYRQRVGEAERPTDFTGAGAGVWLHVMKRQKP